MTIDIINSLDNVKRSIKYLHNNVNLTEENNLIIDCLNHIDTNINYLEDSLNEYFNNL